MKATLKILTALLVLGLAGPATAQTHRRDHRSRANAPRGANRLVKPPRITRQRRPVRTSRIRQARARHEQPRTRYQKPPRDTRTTGRHTHSRRGTTSRGDYGGGYRYHNGLWVYDTPVGQAITDPLWFRYPGVDTPAGPVEIVYDASGGFMWIAGYWDWNGYDWYWVKGFWEQARTGQYWQPGSWYVHNHRRVRRSGHWAPLTRARDHRRIRHATQTVRRRNRTHSHSRFRHH